MKTHTTCLQWPHIVLPNFTTQNSACRKDASPFCLQRRKTWVSTTWNISEEKQLPWTLCLLRCPKPLPLVDDSPMALWFTGVAGACSALQSLFTDTFLSSLSTLPSLVYNGGSLCHAEECSRGIEEEVESCCTLGWGTAARTSPLLGLYICSFPLNSCQYLLLPPVETLKKREAWRNLPSSLPDVVVAVVVDDVADVVAPPTASPPHLGLKWLPRHILFSLFLLQLLPKNKALQCID